MPFPVSDINWRDADKVARDARVVEVGRIAALLVGVEFLEALTTEQLQRLASESRIVPYPIEGAVVRQGDEGDSLFVVAEGRVDVSVRAVVGGARTEPGHARPRRLLRRDVAAHRGAALGDNPRRRGDAPRGPPERGPAPAPGRRSDGAGAPSKTLARRQAEREDAINRAAVSEDEGPGRGPGHPAAQPHAAVLRALGRRSGGARLTARRRGDGG